MAVRTLVARAANRLGGSSCGTRGGLSPALVSLPAGTRGISVFHANRKYLECEFDGDNKVLHKNHEGKREAKSRDSGHNFSGNADCAAAARDMYSLIKERKFAAAVHRFRAVTVPDRALCSTALSACAKGVLWQEASDIWRSMSPELRDIVAYSAMLDVCKRMKKTHVASQVWDEMKSRDIRPNAIAYNTMISCHSMTASSERAAELFEEARSEVFKGANLTSRQMLYVAVMTAFARIGDYARTREFFVKMVEDEVTPNHMHFNSLMSSCARSADAATAQAVFDMMPSYSLKPRSEDYSILIACCRYDLPKAKQVYADFEKQNLPMLASIREQMLEAYVEGKDGPGAMAIIQGSMGELDKTTAKTRRFVQEAEAMVLNQQ